MSENIFDKVAEYYCGYMQDEEMEEVMDDLVDVFKALEDYKYEEDDDDKVMYLDYYKNILYKFKNKWINTNGKINLDKRNTSYVDKIKYKYVLSKDEIINGIINNFIKKDLVDQDNFFEDLITYRVTVKMCDELRDIMVKYSAMEKVRCEMNVDMNDIYINVSKSDFGGNKNE